MDNARGWTTGNELDYLRGLITGEHFRGPGCAHVRQVSDSVLLRNYIGSAKRRKEFGTFGYVDPEVVIHEAEEMLAKIAQ